MKRVICILFALVISLILWDRISAWKGASEQQVSNVSGSSDLALAKSPRRSPRTPPPIASTNSQPVNEEEGEGKRLSREQVEAYLLKTKRSAQGLLNAFSETRDTNYLAEAAQKFPEDPMVQYTMVSDPVTEDRSQWLEKFKASSPDNGLPHYLSALDNFRSGNTENALAEIDAASAKKTDALERERTQSREEMYLLSGYSPLEAREAAFRTLEISHLPDMKKLAWEIDALQKKYKAAGDKDFNRELAAVGIQVASKFSDDKTSSTVINQLVGYSMEHIALSNLDPDTYYDFLGKTAGERMQERKAEQKVVRARAREAIQHFANLSDTGKAIYHNRCQLYGEFNAMRWLNENHGNIEAQ